MPDLPDLPDALRAPPPDDAAFALPEVTRGLRGLGSRRGLPGSDHDRFFAPLLAPLRRAHDAAAAAEAGAADPWARARAFAAAFDAPRMAAELRAALSALAAERCPTSAPDCRALEAELVELAQEPLDALDALAAAAAPLRAAEGAERAAAWRGWCAALARAFAAADRCWLAAVPALCDPRGGGGRLWRRVLRGGGAALAALVTLAAGAAPAAAQGDAGRGDALGIVRVTNASGPDSLDARSLARRGFDVIPGREGEVLVVVDGAERARLEALGARTVALRPQAPAGQAAAVAAPVVYRSFDDPQRGVRVFLDSLARASGGRVRLDTIGLSHERRPILAVQIGQRDDSPSRPNVLFMATYHAREWAATEMALRLARYLASPPAPSPRLDSLLARRDVWVVPVVNPDGYEYTFSGPVTRLWRKNRRPAASPGGAVGVDLNRNHASHWGFDNLGSSPNPASEIYRGPAPVSEPETQAVERFHAEHPPVLSVSYHTYAGMLLYPPGWRFGLLSGDHGVYQKLAGTDERPAVRDQLPGAPAPGYQRPQVSWQLYVTNGEYTDFASERHGTLAFTPELSSGFEGPTFYNFEFPDDEAKLQRLFEDNLPFALDVIESAADPLRYVSPTTGLATPAVALESVAPRVRARVPAALAASTTVRADGASLRTSVDTLGGGRWQRRVVGEPAAAGAPRPRDVTVAAPRDSARFRVLLAGGAEPADTGWTAVGFSTVTGGVTGAAEWRTPRDGTLLSPVVQVPPDVDTVTVALWARHRSLGNPPASGLAVRVSRDGGRSFEPLLTIAGEGPEWYPDSRQLGGVRGRALRLSVQATFVAATLDEIVVAGHLPARAGGAEPAVALRASDNPVRGDAVSFNWPFGPAAGDLFVYDFAGRLVWRTPVDAGASVVTWPVAQHTRLANGVYLAVARAGDDVRRQTLYVLRAAR